MSAQPLLSIRDLAVQYRTRRGPVDAVRGVSFDVEAGAVTAPESSIPHRGPRLGELLFSGLSLQTKHISISDVLHCLKQYIII